ncbi:MAG TPA: acetyl-CoA carboxylase biotin carboxyl carrier protein subunit [Ramlibacter sp.]|uniref:acetyl-CoA carboxylase biotin carboxyl carrier protein subunit n=1 Tax=Ramlibacter sp. TaxID=1917967 RepID=UPI002CE00D38|nr:acetyl-CoA carboxylase biotin carboxyl carrier protein subunit [Ramlibacter sp.]HVZ45784.1 acetyl-CoA carboxylase biotin carboxyl carrier protein subunit [Ramlibacter sp.]
MPTVEIKSDMTGTVISLEKNNGDRVAAGDALILIESMKMEVEIASTASGTLESYTVGVGDAVADGQCIATVSS